jgi:hypothetical protein
MYSGAVKPWDFYGRRLPSWLCLVGAVGCGSKEPPAQISDMLTGTGASAGAAGAAGASAGAGGDAISQQDSGTNDARSDGGEGQPGNGGDFTKCWSDVMLFGINSWFCASTTPGHPADMAMYRNLLYPIVDFRPELDSPDRELDVQMCYDYCWTFMIRAPQGQKLAPGSYTTNPDTDTAIGLTWDHGGTCGAAPESGSFVIHNIEWDMDNKPTTAEIDLVHRCGDSTPTYGRFRLNSKRPP